MFQRMGRPQNSFTILPSHGDYSNVHCIALGGAVLFVNRKRDALARPSIAFAKLFCREVLCSDYFDSSLWEICHGLYNLSMELHNTF